MLRQKWSRIAHMCHASDMTSGRIIIGRRVGT
jgi:hypothetical protein